MNLFRKLRFYPTSLGIRWKVRAAADLLGGRYAWHALDRLGIPGHGTDLLRVDFLPPGGTASLWGYGKPSHPLLAGILDSNQPSQIELLKSCLGGRDLLSLWPLDEDLGCPQLPWWRNEFLTPLDAAVLYGAIAHFQPRRYVEIGSGMSTRVAARAREDSVSGMEIVSVDPEPRLAITGLCDRVVPQRLEELDVGAFLSWLGPGTVLFIDGSHRAFPGSDVTHFFLNLLPVLPKGTLVHLHDIYLPDDYPPDAWNRFWSEQYMLAAYLLGGVARLEVLLPCARLASIPGTQALLTSIFSPLAMGPVRGSSFWVRVTQDPEGPRGW